MAARYATYLVLCQVLFSKEAAVLMIESVAQLLHPWCQVSDMLL